MKQLTLILLLVTTVSLSAQFNINFVANPSVACTGQIISFSSLGFPPATTWHWDFGDGDTSIIQNPTHTYLSGGSFTVTLIASDGVNWDTLVKPSFIIISTLNCNFWFSQNGATVSFSDSSSSSNSNIISWEWYFGDGDTSYLQNPIHIYPLLSACYGVTLTVTDDLNSCRFSMTKPNVLCITGIKELPSSSVSIYPNPTDGKISISLEEIYNDVQVSIRNSLGQFVLSEKFNEKEFQLNFDAPPGIYFLQLEANGEFITKKIIKQ